MRCHMWRHIDWAPPIWRICFSVLTSNRGWTGITWVNCEFSLSFFFTFLSLSSLYSDTLMDGWMDGFIHLLIVGLILSQSETEMHPADANWGLDDFNLQQDSAMRRAQFRGPFFLSFSFFLFIYSLIYLFISHCLRSYIRVLVFLLPWLHPQRKWGRSMCRDFLGTVEDVEELWEYFLIKLLFNSSIHPPIHSFTHSLQRRKRKNTIMHCGDRPTMSWLIRNLKSNTPTILSRKDFLSKRK